MAMFVLLFSKLPGESMSVDVVCASIESTDRLTGRHWVFDRITDLKTTLESAGVSEHDLLFPLQAIQLGIPSFLTVTAETATTLGLVLPSLWRSLVLQVLHTKTLIDNGASKVVPFWHCKTFPLPGLQAKASREEYRGAFVREGKEQKIPANYQVGREESQMLEAFTVSQMRSNVLIKIDHSKFPAGSDSKDAILASTWRKKVRILVRKFRAEGHLNYFSLRNSTIFLQTI
jgi:hypothetical protein